MTGAFDSGAFDSVAFDTGAAEVASQFVYVGRMTLPSYYHRSPYVEQPEDEMAHARRALQEKRDEEQREAVRLFREAQRIAVEAELEREKKRQEREGERRYLDALFSEPNAGPKAKLYFAAKAQMKLDPQPSKAELEAVAAKQREIDLQNQRRAELEEQQRSQREAELNKQRLKNLKKARRVLAKKRNANK